MLSIKDLCQKANISQQTFYRLVRENKEFSDLVEANREKKGNGYRYDTPVLEWLCSYYEVQQDPPADDPPTESAEQPSDSPDNQEQINTITAERDALKRELEALQARWEQTEKERQFLLAQHAQLINILGQEKQEKQLLLAPVVVPADPVIEHPAPDPDPTPTKQTLITRIKSIFKKGQPGN